MDEALVAQSALEAEGIPARAGDLANVEVRLFGSILGNLGRSGGVWVRGEDLERARSTLADLQSPETDEAALEAEALGAGASEAVASEAQPPRAARGFGRGARGAAALLLVLVAVGVLLRCLA
jgi:hypothetical protein